MKHFLALVCTFCMFATMAPAAGATSFQLGGDRLVEMQNNDGGWDWPLNDENPDTGSAANIIGPVAMGLAQSWLQTADPDQLAALEAASAFLQSKVVFSPSDGYIAAQLDMILGGTANTDYVTTHFYDKLAAGTYEISGTAYDTQSYIERIRNVRSSTTANLAAWDIGLGLVSAVSVGYDTSAWIAGVEAEIEELDSNNYYDVLGLAGGIFGLAYAGVEFNPETGIYAAAENLLDLADILASYQIEDGGFTWNSNYVIAGADNETTQETAYALLALNALDPDGFVNEIQGAVAWLESTQLATGGWANYAGGGENNEVTGEALWALAASSAVPEPGTVSLLLVGLLALGISVKKSGK